MNYYIPSLILSSIVIFILLLVLIFQDKETIVREEEEDFEETKSMIFLSPNNTVSPFVIPAIDFFDSTIIFTTFASPVTFSFESATNTIDKFFLELGSTFDIALRNATAVTITVVPFTDSNIIILAGEFVWLKCIVSNVDSTSFGGTVLTQNKISVAKIYHD